MVESTKPAAGGPAIYILSDAFFWGMEAALLIFLLRLTSSLKPSFVSLELLLAGGTLVNLFQAHRHGFINRPYAIVDPLWARGIDPLPVFLAIGVMVGILMLVLAVSHSKKRGRWIDVMALAAVVGVLFLVAPLEKLRDLPQPPPPGENQSLEDDAASSGGTDGSGVSGETGESTTGGQGESTGSGESGQTTTGGQAESTGGSEASGQGTGENPQQGESTGGASQGGEEQNQNSGQGGNSDELSFSDASSGASRNPPVAVVIFRDDYTPDTGMYYFRQNAFSQYNGTKLVADTSGKYDLDVATEFPGAKPVEPQVPPLDKKLFRELDTRVALLTDHAKPFALVNPTRWTAVANPDPKRFQKAYEVTSMVLDKPIKEILGRKAGDPSWDKATWEHYTKGPDDPRYKKLLDEIMAGFPDAPKDDPLIRALMVKLWLEENGVYSLSSRHEGAKDPTASFLFGDRTGYCVFFAHAAVYLYRTAGMPARTGSGYAVEASQRGDGLALLIPGKSAHSWPEVYIEGLGWVVLDIAPSKSLDPPPQQSDPGLQQMLGEMARQDQGEEPPDPAEKKIDVQEMLKTLLRSLLRIVPFLFLSFLVLAYGYKLYRRYAPWICGEKALPDAGLRSLLDMLSDAGYDRLLGEPRAVFSRRLMGISPSFHRLTEAHLRFRLGARETAPEIPWKEMFVEARREIKREIPASKFWKRIFNPVSWWWVR